MLNNISSEHSFEAENSTQVIKPFREGIAVYESKDKFGFIDTTGKIICQPKYDAAEGFLKGASRVSYRKDWIDYYGYVDATGKEIIPVEYTDSDDWYYRSLKFADLIYVGKDGVYGGFDNTGKLIVPFKYTYIKDFRGGYTQVVSNGKWGFMYQSGE